MFLEYTQVKSIVKKNKYFQYLCFFESTYSSNNLTELQQLLQKLLQLQKLWMLAHCLLSESFIKISSGKDKIFCQKYRYRHQQKHNGLLAFVSGYDI